MSSSIDRPKIILSLLGALWGIRAFLIFLAWIEHLFYLSSSSHLDANQLAFHLKNCQGEPQSHFNCFISILGPNLWVDWPAESHGFRIERPSFIRERKFDVSGDRENYLLPSFGLTYI